MKEEITLSKILAGLCLFGSLAVVSLCYFVWGIFRLVEGYLSMLPVIEYDRGAMYGLGVGIGGISFFVAFVIVLINRKISLNAEKRMIRFAFLGIVTIFVTPLITDYTIGQLNGKFNYSRCEKAEYEHSWGIYRTRIYSHELSECNQLTD